MALVLTAPQLRVLGALIEKQLTVPDTYPMTLKGLQTACNQKNSREPVTDYDTFVIQATLDELKALGVVRFVYTSHGARTTKYRHVLDERLYLDSGELAMLAVLFLRGPQTMNELRTRTERAHPFESNNEVEASLEALAAREEPLVVHLPRQTGQKETRWAHLVGADDPTTAAEPEEEHISVTAGAAPTVDHPLVELEARVAELESRLAALEAVVTAPPAPTPTQE